MKRTFLALLLVATFATQATFAQTTKVTITAAEKKIAENITAAQISNYLYFVASDAMGGRDTPSVGLDITAEFLKMNLQRWGFKPAGDNGTFFQKFGLRRDVIDPKATSVKYNGISYEYGEDLARVGGSGSISAPIVFAGNGWMIKSKGLNPYANIDVKGKVIAVFAEGEPGGRSITPLPAGVTQADLTGTRGTDWADVNTYGRANGAAGVLVLPSKFLADNWSEVTAQFGRGRMVVDKLTPPTPATPTGPSFSLLVASPKLAKAIFAGEQGDPMNGATNSFDVGAGKKFELSVATKTEMAWTQNVIALWEGSDPTLKAEMVAVGAHYDHVGTNPNAPGPDKIWNGADDDGSGTVAVLSIAEALAKAPKRPKRSVLLVWHAGEEKGLWGADYFNKFPTVDIKKVIAQLNIDMIGRSKAAGDTNPKNKELSGPNDIYVIGSEMMSSTLGAVVKGTNSGFLKLGYDYKYDDPKDPNRFFFRSDHFHYAQNGIPVTFWFDGEHEDYHQPGDHPDKIDYQKMEKVTRTIFLTMWELTDLKERPKVDKELPAELKQR
ncbi:MAG: M28 family peptidase [Blastocatellia bacterium]|nr:M28 family peptidase [Blastocatellia bacterium]